MRKALAVILGSESPAIKFDHGSGNFRELHCRYQVLKNVPTDVIFR